MMMGCRREERAGQFGLSRQMRGLGGEDTSERGGVACWSTTTIITSLSCRVNRCVPEGINQPHEQASDVRCGRCRRLDRGPGRRRLHQKDALFPLPSGCGRVMEQSDIDQAKGEKKVKARGCVSRHPGDTVEVSTCVSAPCLSPAHATSAVMCHPEHGERLHRRRREAAFVRLPRLLEERNVQGAFRRGAYARRDVRD